MEVKKAMISAEELDSIVDANHGNVFAVLGPHEMHSGNYAVRAFLPEALSVEVVDRNTRQPIANLHCVHAAGVFEAEVPLTARDAYLFNVSYQDAQVLIEDPYRFSSDLNPTDIYLFGEGTHERLYDWLGAQVREVEGVQGTRFTVWAPNARRVSVVGDFNFWDGRRHPMRKHFDSGLWEIFVPGVTEGVLYKYEILSADQGVLPQKADPLGFAAQRPPETASRVTAKSGYRWRDNDWQSRKVDQGYRDQAVTIYEVHLGS